uniref:SET domain-containing protein n=2 Tax=Grammatophora oceanica TaxID=210454 RepID=A0A7S1VIS3_9STRA
MARDLWEFFNMTGDAQQKNRVRVALPEKFEDVKHVMEVGTARHSVPDSIRPMEWLEENGLCLDNIRPDDSTIPQAGKGAFATRFLERGQVIAPAPLVQLRRKDMEVYDSDDIRKKKAKTWRDGTQLLLNYCFGHAESSILLFPYAPVVNYINHGDSIEANAFIRWSAHEGNKRKLLLRTPDELNDSEHAGLMLEFVAKRDIEVGEEVLVDYGEEWQEAWEKYLEEWKPPLDEEDVAYVNPEVLNDIMVPVRTVEEQEEDPYPENIQTLCFVGPFDEKKGEKTKKTDEWGEGYDWTFYHNMYFTNKKGYPCDIVARDGEDLAGYQSVEPDGSHYIAKVYKRKKSKKPLIVRKVPRRAIEFYDRKYQSDLFLRTAFRHEIGLPTKMLPKAWRDVNV